MKLSECICKLIMGLPEHNVSIICNRLKLNENKAFRRCAVTHAAEGTCYRETLVSLFQGPKGNLAQIYHSIEGILLVGGCAPGVGIAFNVIDGCFCLVLDNYLGAFVSLVSCFPMPGFKVLCKGGEKWLCRLVVGLLRKISPADMSLFTRQLGRQLAKTGFCDTTRRYTLVRQSLESLVSELHNPFVEGTVFGALRKELGKFPLPVADMSKTVCKSGSDLQAKYSVQWRGVSVFLIQK